MIKKILIIFCVVLVVGGGFLFSTSAKTTKDEKTFTSEDISNLKEISVDGDFDTNITTSDSKDIKCSFVKTKKGYVSESYEFHSKIENNVLYINTSDKKSTICVAGGEFLKVNIDIPKSYENKLSVKSKLGKINIVDSNSRDIKCDTKDGDTKISLDNICGNITANSHLGNIELKLPKDQKFNLSTSSHLGKITNELNSNLDSSLKEKNIKLSSSDGNITISAR